MYMKKGKTYWTYPGGDLAIVGLGYSAGLIEWDEDSHSP